MVNSTRAEHEVPGRRRPHDGERHASSSRSASGAASGVAGEHDGADHGDHEQHRGDLEGEQVVGEERPRRASRRCVAAGRAAPATRRRAGDDRVAVPRRGAATASATPSRPTPATAASGRWPPSGSIAEVLGLVDAEQHDHEQEQHDDGAGVDDHLHGGEEVGVLGDEQHGDAEQRRRPALSAECTGLREHDDADRAAEDDRRRRRRRRAGRPSVVPPSSCRVVGRRSARRSAARRRPSASARRRLGAGRARAACTP